MKTRVTLPAACVVVLALAPAVLLAQGFPGGHGHGGPGCDLGPGGPGIERMLDRLGPLLGLTEAQEAEIEAIVAAGKPTIEALRQQVADAREAFRADHDPADFDEAAVRAFADAQAPLHSDLMVETLRLRSQVLSVLTDEQRQQLYELRERRGEHRHRHGGMRFGP